jgi:glycosyltransferase involved in cell wall biosynthesis
MAWRKTTPLHYVRLIIDLVQELAMGNPTVSVVMPSYNHGAFIADAIRSVLDQSFQDFEILITVEASTDNTLDVIRSFPDPRIRTEVLTKNSGDAIARNNAIRRARGEFVSMLDSDDCFLPGKLERQVSFLRANPNVALSFGMPKPVDESGNPVSNTWNPFYIPFSHAAPSRQQWLRHFFSHSNCLCHSTVVCRRSVFETVGLYDPRFRSLADFDLWVRACMRYEIDLMRDELVAYRILQGERNMSAPGPENAIRFWFEYFQVLKHYIHLPPELAHKVFAEDIARLGIDTSSEYRYWLGGIATQIETPIHPLFGLDLLFAAASVENDEYRRVQKLAVHLDVFHILKLIELRNRREADPRR